MRRTSSGLPGQEEAGEWAGAWAMWVGQRGQARGDCQSGGKAQARHGWQGREEVMVAHYQGAAGQADSRKQLVDEHGNHDIGGGALCEGPCCETA
jgi:hypothetical protein